jgi:hypothetical protein
MVRIYAPEIPAGSQVSRYRGTYAEGMTREKWSILAVTLIVVAMIVGGCTRSDESKAANKPSATATTATPTPTPTPTISNASGPATCQSAQLKVKLSEDPGGGAAGSEYSHLTFTNIGSRTCAMTGWPGVSYVGSGKGIQIGSPADRTGSATVILVKPGAVAEAQLKESAAGNLDADCIITPADGLRVYPPNTKAAVFVPHTVEACAATFKHLMTIGPVRLK